MTTNNTTSTDESFAGIPKKEQANFLLSLAIACTAAYMDAVGFLLFSGVYLSFMSGNTTRAAVLLGKGAWQDVVPVMCVFPAFVLGGAIGTMMMNMFDRSRRSIVLFIAAIALAIASLLEGGQLSRSHEVRLGPLLLLTATMGLLNPMVQRVDRVSIGLTYVTGTLAKLGSAIGSEMSNRGSNSDKDQTESILILTTVWLAFLIGAIGGGLAAACYGLRCIIAPAVALFALGIFCWPFGASKKST